jgi:HK97 family phage portal protein
MALWPSTATPKARIEPSFGIEKDGNINDDRMFEGLGGYGGPTNSGIDVNTESALRHVTCMACVSGFAEDLAKIPFNVYKPTANGGREIAKGHWLNDLLRKPNDWQTGFEFRELLQASLVLRGNGYAVTVRDGRGRPLYLVPIHPDRVGIWEAPDGQYFYAITRNGLHEWAKLRELPFLVPAYDVLHLRWMSSWNSLLGTSRLSLVRESLGVSIGLEKHQARFVGQGARTSGVLSTEQKFASKETREQLRSEFQRLQSGPSNSGAIAVLEQGLKWLPMGLSMVDSQFIESRNFSVRDIARAFNFPPYRLALEGENEGPAMVQQAQQYLNGPISGYCERWKAKFDQFFELDGENLFVDFDYSHFIKADQVSRYTAYRQSTGAAWQTINEARRSEGLPDAKGGDDVLQPVNMQPLGTPPPAEPKAGPGSDTTGKPGEGGDGDALRDEAGDEP